MKIILKGKLLSTSSIYKMVCSGGCAEVYMSQEGRILKKSYQWQAKSQRFGQPIYEGDLEITVHLFFNSKHRHDWDNFHKISMDALTGIIWEDDSQIQIAHVYKDFCKDNPRIEIDIVEIEKPTISADLSIVK